MTQHTQPIVLTGDRPTGKLHLGHFIGSIQNRLKLQEESASTNTPCYYMVADVQALTDNADNPDKVRNNVREVALDNLACGIDPQKTTMFIQSQVPEIAELTIFFLNLVSVQRLFRNPTVRNEAKSKNFNMDIHMLNGLFASGSEPSAIQSDQRPGIPAGFLAYPVSQAADILTFKSTIIPVGEDQLPVIEQANEIVQKFNSLYGDIFQKITPVVPEVARLMGIDGNAKMSKSLNNAIYLSDSDKDIEQKVLQMYTDPNHIRVEDPGQVEGNVVFAYLDIFDPNKAEVEELKAAYTKGGLGDVALKRRLVGVLQNLIGPIRARREELERTFDVMKILEEGTAKARIAAAHTLAEVRKAIKIDYFG